MATPPKTGSPASPFISKRKLVEAVNALDVHSRRKRPFTQRSVVQFGASAHSISPVTAIVGFSDEVGSLGPYRPWSRADFMKRLETFKVATWFDKPDSLGPVACACWGWTNESNDLLACSTCHTRLLVDITASIPSPIDHATTVDAYTKQLSQAHKSACPWRARASDSSIYHFPTTSRRQHLESFLKRAQSISRLGDKVPLVSLVTLSEVMPALQSACPLPDVPSALRDAALALAIYGWELDTTISSLHCPLCFQSLDTSIFSGQGPDWNAEQSIAGTCDSIADSDAPLECDPVSEHRWYCPWIREPRRLDEKRPSGTSLGHMSATQAGWQQAVHAICTLTDSDEARQVASTADSSGPSREAVSPYDALAFVRKLLRTPDTGKQVPT